MAIVPSPPSGRYSEGLELLSLIVEGSESDSCASSASTYFWIRRGVTFSEEVDVRRLAIVVAAANQHTGVMNVVIWWKEANEETVDFSGGRS